MCKCIKKFLKVIGIIVAVAGAAAGIYFAVKKFTARKECAECTDEFVPCECCDCEECSADEDEAAPAEEETAPEADKEAE